MTSIPHFTRLEHRDVERAAAVVRYVAEHTRSVEEFGALADILYEIAAIYAAREGAVEPIPALSEISLADLQHAAGVAACIANLAPPGEETDVFIRFSRLLQRYVELGTLYYELDDTQRQLLLTAALRPRGEA